MDADLVNRIQFLVDNIYMYIQGNWSHSAFGKSFSLLPWNNFKTKPNNEVAKDFSYTFRYTDD